VTAPPRRDHWFDVLAVRSTRRQGLKAALAGAAALTLPFGRLDLARAANPNGGSDVHACQKGCIYVSHNTCAATLDRCVTNSKRAYYSSMAVELMWSPYFGVVGAATARIALEICADTALLAQKASNQDCRQPECPGFDPTVGTGPCANCSTTANCLCCPDSTSPSGYTECNAVAYTCDPKGGCKRSGR
jgi:hypothetical protein